MRSNFIRCLAVAGLTVALVTSCKSKPKNVDEAPPAAAAGEQNAPVVQDKEILTDPMGSDSGKIPGLSTIFFEYDQARLTADARKKLSENAEWIKSHPNFTIQIEGHTDDRGSVEYNLSLGERRAKSVRAYLESLGIEQKRMNLISYGEEKPVATGDGEGTWSKNRRANFVPLQ